MTMKITVLWDWMLCTFIWLHKHFRGTLCFHFQGTITMTMEAQGSLKPVYIVSHSRRLQSKVPEMLGLNYE